jgi:hypothetical protein
MPTIDLIDLRQLDSTLDLWACMWQPEEQESFATALVRSMTDAHPLKTRLLALAACQILATPRLLAAARRVSQSGVFPVDLVAWITAATSHRHRLLHTAQRLRGNVLAVEKLLAQVVTSVEEDQSSEALLDWIDLRDLVAVARTTTDARLFAEVERRLARRGKYQQGRARTMLGFQLRRPPSSPAVAA